MRESLHDQRMANGEQQTTHATCFAMALRSIEVTLTARLK